MATIDIRNEDVDNIDEILFEEPESGDCDFIAYRLLHESEDDTFVCDSVDFLRIVNKTHANNLIKALNKAIALGWLK